jgi:hypothetical protein
MKTLPQNAKIQINISQKTEFGEFNDALYYTPDEWANLTQDDIDKATQTRVDNWVNLIKNPPPPPEPTKEELEQRVADLENYKTSIDAQISATQDKISEAK